MSTPKPWVTGECRGETRVGVRGAHDQKGKQQNGELLFIR